MRLSSVKLLASEMAMIENERLIRQLGGIVLETNDAGLWFNCHNNSTHLIIFEKVKEGKKKIEEIFNRPKY